MNQAHKLSTALIGLALLACSSCMWTHQPTTYEAGYYPARTDINSAILAGDLPKVSISDLTNELSRSFEGVNPQHSSRHYMDGEQSLMWAWNQQGARLEFHVPVAYQPEHRPVGSSMAHVSIFHVWIYNETAQPDGRLRVSFGNRSRGDDACWFPYGLNFTGWRLIAYKFDMMQGKPTDDMDVIRLTTDLPRGILFFDQIKPVASEDLRWQWPDYQTPELKAKGYDRVLNSLWINSPEMQAKTRQPLTDAQHRDIQKLKQAVLEKTELSDYSKEAADQVEAFFASYAIERDDLSIRGKNLLKDDLRQYLDQYLKLAVLCQTAPSREKQRLTRIFLLISEYLLDQGWAEGSALNAQHHFGYKSRSWAPAMLLMEDQLKTAGLLNDLTMALIWMGRDFTDFTAPFELLSRETQAALAGRLADYLNTFSNTHLCSLLLLPDSQAKFDCLQNFTGTLNAVLSLPNASIKPDGSFYHHRMHYAGYCIPAMISLSQVVAKLDGTAFEISPEAYAKLKQPIWMSYIWGYPGYAFNAHGRHPLGASTDRLRYACRDIAKSVPGTDAFDPDLANMHAIITGEQLLPEQKIVRPEGYWSMNYHASGILKYGTWSVISKGYHDQGVRSHETYGKDNRYGRYSSHGSLMVFAEGSPNHSGYLEDGWNWNKLPGTTTVDLPLDLLEGDAEAFYGWRPTQNVPFSGSSHFNHQAGVFAFQIDGLEHEQAMEARKSVFSLGDLIVCLGSDISNNSTEYPTISTLIQNGLAGNTVQPRSSWHGAYDLDAILAEEPESGDAPRWLIDITGTGYLVPSGNDTLNVTMSNQASRHNKTKARTNGRFFTAWLDHGTAPKMASYEYAMLLGATPERLQNPPAYRVLQQSRSCHAVQFAEGQMTAYSFFAEPENTEEQFAIQKGTVAVNQPSLVIIGKHAQGLSLSICQPIPPIKREFDAPATPTRLKLRLQGHYVLTEASRSATVASNTTDATILDIEVFDGLPTQLELKQ